MKEYSGKKTLFYFNCNFCYLYFFIDEGPHKARETLVRNNIAILRNVALFQLGCVKKKYFIYIYFGLLEALLLSWYGLGVMVRCSGRFKD